MSEVPLYGPGGARASEAPPPEDPPWLGPYGPGGAHVSEPHRLQGYLAQ